MGTPRELVDHVALADSLGAGSRLPRGFKFSTSTKCLVRWPSLGQAWPMSPARGLGVLLAVAACSSSCTEGDTPRGEGAPPADRSVPAPTSLDPQNPPAGAAPAERACPDGGGVVNVSVEVWSQADIDRLRGCERVVGDLLLHVSPGLDYTPLRSLRDVEGTLLVRGEVLPAPQPLEGLRGLEEAGGLELANLQLDSLEPLSALRRLGASTSHLPARPETVEKDTPITERDYVSFYGLSIGACAGLTSLAGLEALEVLDALYLSSNPDHVSITGLSPGLELPELQLSGGGVELRGAPPVRKLSISRSAWTDLSPLGDARALESLALVDNPVLTTLAGAQLPERLESLFISNNPALENLDGLEALSDVEGLSIGSVSPLGDAVESRLTSIEGLGGLERVGALTLYGQTQLRRLAGLEALREVERLELTDNLALESLRGLESLERAGALFLSQSPALASLSGLGSARIGSFQLQEVGVVDLGGLEQVSVETDFGVRRAPQLVSLRGLPRLSSDANVVLNELPALTDAQALEAVTSLGGLTLDNTQIPRLIAPRLQQLRSLVAWGNPELAQLSLGALRTIEQLRVLANPQLVRLDLNQLESAQEIEVTNNSLLDEGVLERLLALGAAPVVIERNGRRPARLDPCPWAGDGLCDETSGLCAEGTDAADCAGP
ncbi:MAG TPA: hypothetical protein VNN80_05625 [Polyangiaceae bacterium]|nr:hypothetical protein [Polyangiaceae bacterium]